MTDRDVMIVLFVIAAVCAAVLISTILWWP
jgi:hypothetical protein